MPAQESTLLFHLVASINKVCIDYTPSWGRGNPNKYIDNLTFPTVLTDKSYQYRIISGGKDLGVRNAYAVSNDGSQKINILEWNAGRGIADSTTIQVYIVDPDNGNQTLIAQWN